MGVFSTEMFSVFESKSNRAKKPVFEIEAKANGYP